MLIPGGIFVAFAGFVVGMVTILHHHRKRSIRRSALPWVLHILGMIGIGVLAAVPATAAGIRYLCVSGAGAQCGLGGVLGTGPMAFGIGALLYAGAYAIWDME